MGLDWFGIMEGANKVCTIGQVPGWLPRRYVAIPGHKISESAVIVLTIQEFINFPLLVLSESIWFLALALLLRSALITWFFELLLGSLGKGSIRRVIL